MCTTFSKHVCNNYAMNLRDLLVIPFLVGKIAFRQNTLTHKQRLASMDGAIQADSPALKNKLELVVT